MLKTMALVSTLGFTFVWMAPAQAGINPGALCADKKLKAFGKYSLDLAKAFGKNVKKINATKLGADISKAESKLTKGFTKAEFTGAGGDRGCFTVGDDAAIESKAISTVEDVIDDLLPSPSKAFVDTGVASLF